MEEVVTAKRSPRLRNESVVIKVEKNVPIPPRRDRVSAYRLTAEAMKEGNSAWFPSIGKAMSLAKAIVAVGNKYTLRPEKCGRMEGFRVWVRGKRETLKGKKNVKAK